MVRTLVSRGTALVAGLLSAQVIATPSLADEGNAPVRATPPSTAPTAPLDEAATADRPAVSDGPAVDRPLPVDEAPRLRTVRRTREAFGTEVQILATASSDEEARVVAAHLEAAFHEIRRVEALLDPRRETSDIARLNASAGHAPVVVDPEVFAVLSEAGRLARLTKGAFDPTFAVLNDLWRALGAPAPERASSPQRAPAVPAAAPAPAAEKATPAVAAASPSPPAAADIEARLSLVGFRDLSLDPAARTASLARAEQRIDLAGLAKGYALDRAALALEERGLTSFLIAAGGDLVVRGTHGDRPWQIGIQDPRAPGHFATLPARPGAVMTTGDYERFFFSGGKRYHHVLDPRTGRPAEGLRSVTILAEQGPEADALSTAVFVLGPERGLALVERLRGVEAVLVTTDNRVLVSKGLEGSVKYRPPTDAP